MFFKVCSSPTAVKPASCNSLKPQKFTVIKKVCHMKKSRKSLFYVIFIWSAAACAKRQKILYGHISQQHVKQDCLYTSEYLLALITVTKKIKVSYQVWKVFGSSIKLGWKIHFIYHTHHCYLFKKKHPTMFKRIKNLSSYQLIHLATILKIFI